MEETLLYSQLNYFSRERYWHHVGDLASEGLTRLVNEPSLQFYYAFSLLMQDRAQESIREFEAVKDHPDVAMGALAALAQAHRACKTVDKEALQEIETSFRDSKKSASEKAYYFTALYYFFTGKYDKARECIDRAMKTANAETMVLKGWIELYGGRDMKGALKFFEDSLEIAPQKKFPDSALGKTKYFELRQNYSGALETINQAAAQHPNFLPIQLEKMKAQLSVREWDQAMETAQRCHIIDSTSIEALKFMSLYTLCFDGRSSDVSSYLQDLVHEIERSEPKNVELQLSVTKLFVRVCGRNQTILHLCRNICEKLLSLAPSNADVVCECADEARIAGQTKQAMKLYRQAVESQQGSALALVGIIHCHVLENELKEAEAQVEFLHEVQKNVQLMELKYLEALLKFKKTGAKSEFLGAVTGIMDDHMTELQSYPFGPEYFCGLNPDFLMEIIGELMQLAPSEQTQAGLPAESVLKLAVRILEVIVQAIPGFAEALYILGKIKYLLRETDGAQTTLQLCLAKDQSFAEAHLLLAQIYALQDNYKLASQTLEVGVSYNFEIREHPIYHLIKARIQKRTRDMTSAVQTLETAMKLPGFKQGSQRQSTSSKQNRLEMTNSDRASVYLELIDCYQTQNRTEDATKLIQEAMQVFQGTKEEQRLMLSNAELALSRGDIEKSITLLKAVTPDQPHYLQARQRLADVYLNHKKDKRQFAICYRELVEKNPTPQAFVMLGDAYMSVQEPDRAIENYESALKKNPKDSALARKIGQAYVKSHQYQKAVSYYEAAMKSGQQNLMRHDLADLLLKLKNYEKCEKVLKAGLERQPGMSSAGDVQSLMDEVKFLILLSKVYFHTNVKENALSTLLLAKDQQSRVVKRGPVELADTYDAQKKLFANICCQLAESFQNQRDFDRAIKNYKEALTVVENDAKIMLALAHLHLLLGDLDSCNQQCMALLKVDKDNDQATLMLADLMYQKNEVEAAQTHFQRLLDRNPCQYYALARLIELFWRNGDLDQANKYLTQAEQSNMRALTEPGFCYCKGLYEWCSGDPNAALHQFNRARRDKEWGEKALFNMIDICLNPENQILGGEVFESVAKQPASNQTDFSGIGLIDGNLQQSQSGGGDTSVRTAQSFLKELRYRVYADDYRYSLVESFILLATGTKSNIEVALGNFNHMAADTSDGTLNVGAILGVARAYQMLKQTPKAKQELKRVIGHPWNFEDAEHLEQCWLLLADMYINQNKYDVATEILKTCIQHNQSCLKAYEYMGFIKEKEQKWADAAINYELAWKLCRKRNPAIGYKLAFNYLKAKRLIDAIDVCHRVLELYPQYPKMKKDILDKARMNLRS